MRTHASSGKRSGLRPAGEQHRLADAHHPHGDPGTFPRRRIAQIDAGIHGARRQPEFALRQIWQAPRRRARATSAPPRVPGRSIRTAPRSAVPRAAPASALPRMPPAPTPPAWTRADSRTLRKGRHRVPLPGKRDSAARRASSGSCGGANRCGISTTRASRACSSDGGRRRGIVNHHRAGAFRHALQHGIAEVPFVRRRPGARAPQLPPQRAIPLAVVIDELVHILASRSTAPGRND